MQLPYNSPGGYLVHVLFSQCVYFPCPGRPCGKPRYPLATMPTVLWETVRCCITLHCVVRLGLIMSWPSMFLFGSAILHANNLIKNVLSEFVLLCKKAAPLHFIQATPQLVLSALIGKFANKVACFSRIVSHPIAKSHVKPWSVREHDTSPTVPSVCFRTVEIDIKHQR